MTVVRSIFISYRRQDSIDVTGRIHDRLVAQFGSDGVFKDVDAIPFGVDFRKHLEQQVSHCPTLLAIIGPNWFNATDARGNRRLDDPTDWVRLEIETALSRDSVVIPVLVGGAKLPRDTELPTSLKGLAYRQSALVRHDPDFHRDVDRLIQRIEEVFKGLTLTGQAAPGPSFKAAHPYPVLIDDLTAALTTATKSAQANPHRPISRRRWLRLTGLGLLAAGGTVATRRWWPSLGAMASTKLPELPDLSTWPHRLQSALAPAQEEADPAAEAEDDNDPIAQPPARYTYQSVTVDDYGVMLYQTKFTTDFYDEILLNTPAGSVSLPLVAITGGQFLFGTTAADQSPEVGQIPQTIEAVKSFWIGIYPVTQQQWRAVAQLPAVQRELNPEPSYFSGDNLPVEQLSWPEAVEFCQRLSRYTGQRFRLPTETEWEFACRAKTTTPFHFGQTLTTDLANYDGTQAFRSELNGLFRGYTTSVGYFQTANDFGLYEMHGNVLEWCSDRWDAPPQDSEPIPPLPAPPGEVPLAPPVEMRVLRGGSWKSPPQHCHSAYRIQRSAHTRSNTIGFRIVREID